MLKQLWESTDKPAFEAKLQELYAKQTAETLSDSEAKREIAKLYKSYALKYHPDKHHLDHQLEATEIFQEIQKTLGQFSKVKTPAQSSSPTSSNSGLHTCPENQDFASWFRNLMSKMTSYKAANDENLVYNFLLSFCRDEKEESDALWQSMQHSITNNNSEQFRQICANKELTSNLTTAIRYVWDKTSQEQHSEMIMDENFSALISIWQQGYFEVFQLAFTILSEAQKYAFIDELIRSNKNFYYYNNSPTEGRDCLTMAQFAISSIAAEQKDALLTFIFKKALASGQLPLLRYSLSQLDEAKQQALISDNLNQPIQVCLLQNSAAVSEDNPENIDFLWKNCDKYAFAYALQTNFFYFYDNGCHQSIQRLFEIGVTQELITPNIFTSLCSRKDEKSLKTMQIIWDYAYNDKKISLYLESTENISRNNHINSDLLAFAFTKITTAKQKTTLLCAGSTRNSYLIRGSADAFLSAMSAQERMETLLEIINQKTYKRNEETGMPEFDGILLSNIWKTLTSDEQRQIFHESHLLENPHASSVIELYGRFSLPDTKEYYELAMRAISENKYDLITRLFPMKGYLNDRCDLLTSDFKLGAAIAIDLGINGQLTILKNILRASDPHSIDKFIAEIYNSQRLYHGIVKELLADKTIVTRITTCITHHALSAALQHTDLTVADILWKNSNLSMQIELFDEAWSTNNLRSLEFMIARADEMMLCYLNQKLADLNINATDQTKLKLQVILTINDHKLARYIKNPKSLKMANSIIPDYTMRQIENEETKKALDDICIYTNNDKYDKQAQISILFENKHTQTRLNFFSTDLNRIETHCNTHKNEKWDRFLGKTNTKSWNTTFKTIRTQALVDLKSELVGLDKKYSASSELAATNKLELLNKCRNSDLFKKHRNNYFFQGAFGRTNAVKEIDRMISEIKLQRG